MRHVGGQNLATLTGEVSRTVFAWGASEVAAEKAAEGSDAFEADLQTDVGDAVLTSFEHALGVGEALSLQVLVWRFSKDLAKQPVKMEGRKTRSGGDLS